MLPQAVLRRLTVLPTEELAPLAGRFREHSRALAAKVKALSSEGRASALILSALPAIMISMLMLLQPRFYTDKFSDPIFWPVTTAVLILYLVGWLVIRRIINFKY